MSSPDKKIYCAGSNNSCGNEFTVLRLNEYGTVDSTFGTNPGYCASAPDGWNYHRIAAIHLQPDGKLLAGGYRGNPGLYEFYILSLLNDSVNSTLSSEFIASASLLANVFPNPFENTIFIEFSFPEPADVSFQLADLSGKVLRSFSFENKSDGINHVELDMGGIAAGAYLLKVQLPDQTTCIKVMKQ